MGFQKIYLQMDLSCALDFLLGDPPDDVRHESYIRETRQLLARDWEVSTSHIYRESNTIADLLAHYGHSLGFGLHLIPSLPRFVSDCIQADIIGIMYSRFIPVNN
ncbi:Putative ribonuclease H protein At1g65750 [Linum grandiflorum]